MIDFDELVGGARVLADTLTDVKPGEQVLIVLDTSTSPRIGEAASVAVRERGGVPVVNLMDTLPFPNSEPPSVVAAAMLKANVIFGFVTQSLFHTKARLSAAERGARMLSCTGIVEETLIRGPIKADFFGLEPVVDDIAQRATAGNTINVTSPAGTNLTASIKGRTANREIWSREPGQASGAPSIEVNIAPVEGTADGVIVIDASVASIGLVHDPIRLTVQEGKVTRFSGGTAAEELESMIAATNDPRSYVIAEIGIGLNPEGKVTGNIFEDESSFGTAHVAIGKNTAHGGNNPAPIHVDMVFRKPTIEIDGHIIVGANVPTLPPHQDSRRR